MGRVDIFIFFLNLARKLFIIKYDTGCGFATNVLYYVDICSLGTHFDESFHHEWMLNSVKCYFFSESNEIMMWFLSFLLLMQCTTFVDLQMLNHPHNPDINPTWSWCIDLFIYGWNWYVNIFTSVFIKDIGHQRFCFIVSWYAFAIRVMAS